MGRSNLSIIRMVAIFLVVVVILAIIFMPGLTASLVPLPWIALGLAVVGAIWSHLELQKQG